jgi:hypothetical protein
LRIPAHAPARLQVVVTNPTDEAWSEAPVTIKVDPSWNPFRVQSRLALIGTDVVLVQEDDLDKDGRIDEWSFLVALAPRQRKTYEVGTVGIASAPPPARAHALMSLKGFDGPAWESDVIGYRIYWNLDNAMDVFGKSQPIL